MTKEEFIKKWVVAYESKEQQIEFANEMKADLDGLVELHPSITHINAKNLSESTIKIINKMVEKVNENENIKQIDVEVCRILRARFIGLNHPNIDAYDDDYVRRNYPVEHLLFMDFYKYSIKHLTTENLRLRGALEEGKTYTASLEEEIKFHCVEKDKLEKQLSFEKQNATDFAAKADEYRDVISKLRSQPKP